ncbi:MULTISPECIES: NUDIX hydrolase [unclassified Chelatococcus]|uniref:NUDIX hydrolase n=1 Tax=unclassified Chelatococcus TaxID=2638111 RepID=UPI0024BE57B9|nr:MULTISPECIES: NUDIX hydrolase [unclassified Chelatococcus]
MALVIRNQHILMIRRLKTPDAGLWSFPAGKVELGETIEAAAIRELFEETGVRAAVQGINIVTDAITHSDSGMVQGHFAIFGAVCRWTSGEPRCGDDAAEARWVSSAEVGGLHLARAFDVADIARKAFARSQCD